MDIKSKVTLNNGVEMPWFGLGVFLSKDGEEVENAVKVAFQNGYRHINTAAIYKNTRIGVHPVFITFQSFITHNEYLI